MTEYTSTELAALLGLTVSAIQRKAQRIRERGQPCGTYKYGRWLYTDADMMLLKIDYRSAEAPE